MWEGGWMAGSAMKDMDEGSVQRLWSNFQCWQPGDTYRHSPYYSTSIPLRCIGGPIRPVTGAVRAKNGRASMQKRKIFIDVCRRGFGSWLAPIPNGLKW